MNFAVPVSIFCAARTVVLVLTAALQPLPTTAQAPATAVGAIPPEALKEMEQLSGPGGLLQGSSERIDRMTDPNAGKRPGDEKLNCKQIKAEFEDTNRKYTAQEAKQEAAKEAVEADARKLGAEAGANPTAIASGFFGGLAAITAHTLGAGDAYNEKLKAEAMATGTKRASLQKQFAQEAEASKALSDRGSTLMALGKSKGCAALFTKL